jgi:hypothetical protein
MDNVEYQCFRCHVDMTAEVDAALNRIVEVDMGITVNDVRPTIERRARVPATCCRGHENVFLIDLGTAT